MKLPHPLIPHLAKGAPDQPISASVTLDGDFIVSVLTKGALGNGFRITLIDPVAADVPFSSVYTPASGSFRGSYVATLTTDSGAALTDTFSDIINDMNNTSGFTDIYDVAGTNTSPVYAMDVVTESGVDGTLGKADSVLAMCDADYLYLCVGDATVSDSSGWKKIALSAL